MAKYCKTCGKPIHDKAMFCKFCGSKVDSEMNTIREQKPSEPIKAPVDLKQPSVSENNVQEPVQDEKITKQTFRIIIAIGIVVIIVAVIGILIALKGPKNEPDMKNFDATESVEDNSENQLDDVASESNYKVGNTYTVLCNLRVREGPNTSYRILQRYELTSEDYDKSVDFDTSTDAVLSEGSQVTCLEMSGNWMKISSGWICVELDGEVMVK